MGYLFLAAALLTGAAKGYCGKKTSGSLNTYSDAMLSNLVRMVLCVFIGFALLVLQGKATLLATDSRALAIMLLSGVSTSTFVVSWVISVKRGAFMMLDVFLFLGILVPMLLCGWFYNEPVRPTQWLGFAILCVAAWLMCSYNASIKGKMNLRDGLLLVLCGLSNGLCDFSQKSFRFYYPQGDASVFNFYTYLFSVLVLLACFLLFSKKERTDGTAPRSPAQVLRPIIWYIVIMSACLFFNSFFKLQAANYLTAPQLYPLERGGGIILATFMSSVFFQEKITPRCIVGLVIAFAALLIMNLL